MTSSFEEYLKDIPLLHTWDNGNTWNTGGFNSSHLLKMYTIFRDEGTELKYIETGSGNSTILFGFVDPNLVVSISPDEALHLRIRQNLERFLIETEKILFICEGSEWALPRLALDYRKNSFEFDVALIDGEHSYPQVFLDFFYLNFMLKKGGLLLVDDVQIYSCRELSNFLCAEEDFQLEHNLGKLHIFRRTSDRRILSGWKAPYILKKMKELS